MLAEDSKEDKDSPRNNIKNYKPCAINNKERLNVFNKRAVLMTRMINNAKSRNH